MSEKIKYSTISLVERKIEDMDKEELYNSLKEYCEEIGMLKEVEDDDNSILKFICKNFSIELEDDEIVEESLKSSMIEILYNNNVKDNLILFESLNFMEDSEDIDDEDIDDEDLEDNFDKDDEDDD